ncbi:MAG: transglycosylase domain-containing protein [Saprospiraceae bacterium]
MDQIMTKLPTPPSQLQLPERLRQIVRRTQVRWNTFVETHPRLSWCLRLSSRLALLGTLLIITFLISIRLGAFGALPSPAVLAGISNPLASEVYAADGTLLGRYYFENRSNVKYENISPHFIHALVATEDARFFQHNGVDLRAWFRVFFKTILFKDRSSGGGSTLSQQLAKNLFPRHTYGTNSLVITKLKEVFIAMHLENIYTKEEILEMYLNTVPFSENTFGIKVASQRFFGIMPDELTPDQAAVLVAMLKATAVYNPVTNPEKSLERRNLVLRQMAKYGYLSQGELDTLQEKDLSINYSPLSHNIGTATYFREHLRLELKKALQNYKKSDGSSYNLYTDGLKIYTTIDSKMQRYAESAVRAHLAKLQRDFIKHLDGAPAWENDTILLLAKQQSQRYQRMKAEGYSAKEIDAVFATPIPMTIFDWQQKEKKVKISPMDSIKYYLSLLNAGMLAVEPASGAVKVWVGGPEYKYFKYDHVKSRRQVGSTFKPVVYATALENGMSPCDRIGDYLRTYAEFEDYTPQNSNDEYGGSYTMEQALTKSINTIAVNVAVRTGLKSVAQMAQQLGMNSQVPPVPAIALGAHEASLLDMVQIYSTFANRGVRPELYYISRIETTKGSLIYRHHADKKAWKKPISTDHADIVTHMLCAAVDQGTGRRLRNKYKFKNPIAGKTGTSQHHSDGWFVGYMPNLAAGVWVGGESPSVRFRDLSLGQGANMALPVFALFLKHLQKDEAYKPLFNAKFPKQSAAVREALDCYVPPPVETFETLMTSDKPKEDDKKKKGLFGIFKKDN